jgi:hypothetical protein
MDMWTELRWKCFRPFAETCKVIVPALGDEPGRAVPFFCPINP